jgi:hypothetical protein
MENTEEKPQPKGNQLPLPKTFEEAKRYFAAGGPLIPLHYDTSGDQAVERDADTMRQLAEWYRMLNPSR